MTQLSSRTLKIADTKFSWTSARCNRLLRPLSSKIALLRKTALSEPRPDECDNGTASSSCHISVPTTRAENEWEASPRPWKKIKRTYSSRTISQSSQDVDHHDKRQPLKETSDATIRLPLDLTADQTANYEEDPLVRNSQRTLSAQTAPPRVARATSRSVQIFHGSQDLDCAVSTRLSNQRLIQGICKALEALLRATTCGKINDNGGPHSLFSTCLRQVPKYITEEQRLTDDDDPENDTDVASEVYTDLEAFGSASDGGWEPLREVVRAHGVALVQEAIQEGLIEYPLSRHILSLCLGLAAYDEAERIIESMIACLKCRSFPAKKITGLCAGLSSPVNKCDVSCQLPAVVQADDAFRIANALRFHVSRTGRHGFMYRQTAAMLENGIFSVDWISSKAMIECWNGVIRSITQNDGHAQAAASLLQIAISRLYRRGSSTTIASSRVHDMRLGACGHATARSNLRSYKSGPTVQAGIESMLVGSKVGIDPDHKDNASQSIFSNVLAVLSAVNILRSPKLGQESSHTELLSVAILRDIALEIRQTLELSKKLSSAKFASSVAANQACLPLLATGLVSITSREACTEISPSELGDLATLASLPSSKESVCYAGSFLCKVARCCDEAGLGDGFHFVQAMVQNLISIAISDTYDKPIQRYCSSIAHAAAFAFSEDTGQPKHLNWALEIEGMVTRIMDGSIKAVVDQTPARFPIRNRSGYKWEEGICEWIAKTPALALEQPSAVADVDLDSAYDDAPKVTLVQALPLPSRSSPCVMKRRLPRRSCNIRAEGASYDEKRLGNSTEKPLFVRVSPRLHKSPRLQCVSPENAANDLDELSRESPPYRQPVALREIPNPPLSGVRRKIFGRKHGHDDCDGTDDLDVPPPTKKRVHLDAEMYSQDTEDELG